MEKIVVEIGINKPSESEKSVHAKWLAETFEMSLHRAHILVNKIQGSRSITVTLDYRQLARYTAKRATENLVQVWHYPRVVEHIEDQMDIPLMTFELRPGLRTK